MRGPLTAAVVALAALTVVCLAPSAAAQDVGETNVELGLPPVGELPAGDTHPTSANIRYGWENGMTTEGTEIRLEVEEEPEWLNTTFVPSRYTVDNTTRSPSGRENIIADINLTIAEDAPAFQEGTATYSVVAEENPPLQGDEGTAELTVTPGFRGGVDVELPEGGNVTAWGGVVTEVPMEVTSDANGPVAVQTDVVLSPADARLDPPEEFTINATEGQRTQTVHLDVRVPWSVSIEGDVAVELDPEHVQRGEDGRNAEAGFHLEGNSAIPVPAPPPAVVVGLVGLAAVALRRRQG